MLAVSTPQGAWNAWQNKLAANPLLPLVSPTGREDHPRALIGAVTTAEPERDDRACEVARDRAIEGERE
jgi:hypothetical protein